MTPITIFTGFLGSGKTTIIRTLIQQNPGIRFGLIINEFGEIGIDAELVKTTSSGQQIVEISNGCLCCVVRSDLQDAVKGLLETGEVDYIIIETSGLAEPLPIAQTFLMDNLQGKVKLDAIVCLIDTQNFSLTLDTYKIALEQLECADIIVLNKVEDCPESQMQDVETLISKTNPRVPVFKNDENFATSLLIDAGKWSDADVEHFTHTAHSSNTSDDHNSSSSHKNHDYYDHHEHENEHDHQGTHGHHEDAKNVSHHHDHHQHDHHHEHDEVDELVFSTKSLLDPHKLDDYFQNYLPKNVIRAKGFLRLKEGENGMFVFQMVGSKRVLLEYTSTNPNFDWHTTRLVLIGKKLDKNQILQGLHACIHGLVS